MQKPGATQKYGVYVRKVGKEIRAVLIDNFVEALCQKSIDC